MKASARNRFGSGRSLNVRSLVAILITTMFAMTPCVALANKKGPSLPAAILGAKSVYIDNQTTDAALQNAAHMSLAKWGRFQVVDSVQKADVILRLTGSNYVHVVPSDTPPMSMASANARGGSESAGAALLPNGYEAAPDGFTRVTLLDAKSGNAAWSDLSKTNSPQAATHILDSLREAFEQSLKNRDK